MKYVRACVAAVCMFSACTASAPPAGRQVWSGQARALVTTKSGSALAWLAAAHAPNERGAPPDLLVGRLMMAETAPGAAARDLGEGVTSLEGSEAFSPDGAFVAWLAKWRFANGNGELWIASVSGGVSTKLCDAASTFVLADADVTAICDGALWRGGRGGAVFREVHRPAREFENAQDGIVARGPSGLGGKLVYVTGSDARPLAEGTGDFALSPDRATVAWTAGPQVHVLRLADNAAVAANSPRPPSRIALAPDRLAAVYLVPQEKNPTYQDLFFTGNPAPVLVGRRVGDFSFGAAGALAYLENYDAQRRVGVLTVLSGMKSHVIAKSVQDFSWSPSGHFISYLVRNAKVGFTIELWIASGEAGTPHKVDEGVWGYQLSPDERRLYYKARCGEGARSCAVLVQPIEGGATAKVAEKIAGFELSRDGRHLLLLAPHHGSQAAVDLRGVPANGGEPTPIARNAEPGARLLGDGASVAFVENDSKHAGVWIATLP